MTEQPKNTQETNQENTQPKTDTPQSLLAGKYKSVEALEEGYKNLSTKLREQKTTTDLPESYTAPEELGLTFDTDGFNHMQSAFKEAGLNQEQVDKLLGAYATIAPQSVNLDAEKAALGDGADARLAKLGQFIGRHFSDDEQAELDILASTAGGVKVLEKLMTMSGEKPVPADSASAAEGVADLRQKAMAMLSEKDFRHNTDKQQAYNQLWAKIAKQQA